MQERFKIYENKLLKEAKENNIELDENQSRLLVNYMLEILEENKKLNLTKITDPDDFIEKHLIDSLLSLRFIQGNDLKVIDIGTGGGFPGVVLAIMKPDSKFYLLDSVKKKLLAVERILKKLDIKNVLVLHARAEEASKLPAFREKFDYAICRALAALPVLSELCLPFVKVDGELIALKSRQYKEELEKAEEIIKNLGGKVKEIKEEKLLPSESTRVFIVIEKVENTPSKFPRSYSKIKKSK